VLPQITPSQLDLRPVDLSGLPSRYMNPGELEVLIALVASVKPKSVLEFGCNVGRTAVAILRNVPGIERYQGIDVPKTYVPSKRVQKAEVPDHPGELVRNDRRFELLIRPRGSLDLVATDLAPCDAVFIDGDHGAFAVRHDTLLATTVVRPGGIIIWHDYHNLGTVDVREVLNHFYAAGEPIVHVAGTWIAFRRTRGHHEI
jgi:predicted O-methyltransferase YrrM